MLSIAATPARLLSSRCLLQCVSVECARPVEVPPTECKSGIVHFLSCVAMQLETNVRAEIADVIGATDASETYGGICRVRVPFSAKVDLYDRCEGSG